MAVVLVIGALGVVLALQGWRSRVPGTEVIPYIDGAHSLLAHGRLPDRGVVTSLASYAPPGLAWIVLPGVSLFSDPRLFDLPGFAILHLGTLIGIFLLARICFGARCALLAVLLYGLSERGLMFTALLGAGSPGPRGHPFFYVWMAYWTCCWVTRQDARYLAAALMTWLTGMFVFMEVAPAVFILPAVWALYRPPVRFRSLAVVGVFAVLMWYPYLRFESTRGFADIRSQLLLQSLAPASWSDVLCDSTLTMSRWEGPLTDSAAGRDPQPPTHTVGFVLASGRRVLAIARGLVVNFEGQMPGIEVILLVLTLGGLLVLKMPRARPRRNHAGAGAGGPVSLGWLTTFAVGLLILSALANEVVIGRALSSRESLSADVVSTIRIWQIMAALGGIALLMRGSIARAGDRLAIELNSESRDAQVFAVALIVPWLILLVIAEWGRQDRLVWLWPLQAIVLAFVCSSVWARLGRSGRFARLAGPIAITGAILANPLVISKVEDWIRDGWAGPDAVEIRIVDYLAGLLHKEGRDRAAIGYRRFTDAPLAPLTVDNWWKVGAEFDMTLRFRHGISNLNECVEGLSAQDEYRVIEAHPPTPGDPYYFDVMHRGRLRFLDQIGEYELYEIDRSR